MTPAEAKTQRAIRSSIAASLTFEARQKDHEAACWLGLARNIEEAAANVHSALDAVLDARAAQIHAVKEANGGGNL